MARRTYLSTHPWLKFDLGSEKFGSRIWMLLGEAASKSAHLAGVPLAPDVAKRFHELFMAKGAQATTAIEGNTLTEEQVGAQIAGELKLPPSQKYLQDEVQNIIDAFGRILEDLHKNGPRRITTEFIGDLNKQVLANLELDEDITPGAIRRHNVTVGTYRGAPPEDCKYLLDEMTQYLNSEIYGTSKEIGAILKALFAHIYIALIHPFSDGNGRTARLLEFYLLLQAGHPSPAGHLLSNHYNKTRSRYYEELSKISKRDGYCADFVEYALAGFVDGLREQIDKIKELQMEVAWENYVHERFRGQKSASDSRRRELVLQLGKSANAVRISSISELTPRLAKEYANKTSKTLSRDLNMLLEMGLIIKDGNKRILATKATIWAFLPFRAPLVEPGPR